MTTYDALQQRRSPHVPELDGVRGIAIAGVMALHFVGAVSPTNLLERVAVKVSGYGLWGVDLFFVLSGFLITGILLRTRTSPRYLRDFYMRRLLRIFPLYYGVLVVMCVLLPAGLAAALDPQLLELRRLQAWLWLYLSNVYLGAQSTWSIPYLSHFWSLAIEEHFYLAWPVLVLVLSHRAMMRLSVVLCLSALGLRIAFAAGAPDLLYADTLTPCRLDALCVGGWFALAARADAPLSADRALKWVGGCAAAVLALSLWHAVIGWGDLWTLSARTTLLAAFFGAGIYWVVSHPRPSMVRDGLRAPWLRFLGKYSYGLYVFHGIISYAISRSSLDVLLLESLRVHSVAAVAQITLGVALSLVLAVASYEVFEVRFLKLKSRFDPSVSMYPAALERSISA